MALSIEDYALIGDTHTAALVGRDGSIDWLCLPRFDSPSCFARLLGNHNHGFWRIAPQVSGAPGSTAPQVSGAPGSTAPQVGRLSSATDSRATEHLPPSPLADRRRYRKDSLVLETEFDTPTGTMRVTDFMPIREQAPEVVRIVECLEGTVDVAMDLCVRFDFGAVLPWVRHVGGLLTATAGPDALALWTPVEVKGQDFRSISRFSLSKGQRVPFVLSWFPSHDSPPRPSEAAFAALDTDHFWQEWISACNYEGPWSDVVRRSLITLKALTYAPTGGIVAAPTTSLPESLGGNRNWDYRYCWLRDATLTLEALMLGGFHEEAMAWRDWLLRSAAGDPSKLQIMYGISGERRLEEYEVDWLPGYEDSRPVRVGNAAAGQYQLDVYGEVIAALHEARAVCGADPVGWDLETAILEFLEKGWQEPDDGIWEVRGQRQHFTYSKVMAWVAFDRAVKAIEHYHLPGPLKRWRAVRDEIHKEVCAKGYDEDYGSFTQYYGSKSLDASLLLIPAVGFLPPNDPRVVNTVEAIARELTEDGFVLRYKTEDNPSAPSVDGLSGHEGAFLACSFWLVDCWAQMGRRKEATELFEKLISITNDLGLLAEEYDASVKRQVGNFPQAFSHISLVHSAFALSGHKGDLEHMSRRLLAGGRRPRRRWYAHAPHQQRDQHGALAPEQGGYT
jgi:GH15 family glucan-1,4-alpha-glucosidase